MDSYYFSDDKMTRWMIMSTAVRATGGHRADVLALVNAQKREEKEKESGERDDDC